MDLTEKLRVWGAVHAQARNAREAVARTGAPSQQEAQRRAQLLQQQADRLHREIYAQIGRKLGRVAEACDASL